MARLMLSWMAQKYKPMELRVFRTEFQKHCLVWEPGNWHPPSKTGGTVVTQSGAGGTNNKGGDSLAIVLEPKPGQDKLVLGRDAACDLVVDDATVSGQHLHLIARAETWIARNPGSTNGTWVNDKPLPQGIDIPLVLADRIRVGNVALTYYDPKGLYFRLKAS